MGEDIYKGKRILITQNRLWSFAGSEMVTLELAGFFAENGALVTVYCLGAGDPIVSEFHKIRNLTLVNATTALSFSQFEIVWIHHQLLPESMLQELAAGIELPVVVVNHMSHIEPLELPYMRGLEESIASLSVFNSEKTLETLRLFFKASGYERFALFPNPAPNPFLESAVKRPHSDKPTRIAIVSNHPPDEILGASESLKEEGLQVEFIGEGGNYVRMTPDVLSRYDAVVTIGKTCQYALVMGIPVYCYDHFGGPGYLSEQNYRNAASWHFSGRQFGKKSADQIRREIAGEFHQAQLFSQSRMAEAKDEYAIGCNVGRVLCGTLPKGYVKIDPSVVSVFSTLQKIVARISALQGEVSESQTFHKAYHQIEESLVSVVAALNQKRSEVEALQSRCDFLSAALQSVELWQGSWFRRAFSRWHLVRHSQERAGIFGRFERSIRKRLRKFRTLIFF